MDTPPDIGQGVRTNFTGAQHHVLEVVDHAARGASRLSRRTSANHNTVHAASARSLVRLGVLEVFMSGDGWHVRRARTGASAGGVEPTKTEPTTYAPSPPGIADGQLVKSDDANARPAPHRPGSRGADTRQIDIAPPLWAGLQIVAAAMGSTASREIRNAIYKHLSAYGITVTEDGVQLPDGEFVDPSQVSSRRGNPRFG